MLSRINATPYLFQLVVDENGRLLGTVTDGDVRRAMLRGTQLDETAAVCAQRNPVTGRIGAHHENLGKLRQIARAVAFLPILDEQGIVREILISQEPKGSIATALLMAGGPGTRLGELTQRTPKPMLPVGGKPIIGHILDQLEQAGVCEIYVAVHYLPDQIERFIGERDNKVPIRLLREEKRLGTAGALSLLPPSQQGPVLVMNGDVMTQVNFQALRIFHDRHALDGTIGVARHAIEIPYGVIHQSADGAFERIEEKPRIDHFVAAGVYYLSPAFLALVAPGQPLDMPELLNLGRSAGLHAGLFPIHEYWIDVGRPNDLDAATRDHAATIT